MKPIDPQSLQSRASEARERQRAREAAEVVAQVTRNQHRRREYERAAGKILTRLLPELAALAQSEADRGRGGVSFRILYTSSNTCMITPPASIEAFTEPDRVLVEVLTRRLKRHALRTLKPQISFYHHDPGNDNRDEYYGGSAWCRLTLSWDPDTSSESLSELDLTDRLTELRRELSHSSTRRAKAA